MGAKVVRFWWIKEVKIPTVDNSVMKAHGEEE